MKRRRPSPVKDVLAAALREAGVAQRVGEATVVIEWADRVGPQIAGVTRALGIGPRGTLFVNVKTSAWLTELKLMERSLLETLNAGRKIGRVRRIVWRVGSISHPRRRTDQT